MAGTALVNSLYLIPAQKFRGKLVKFGIYIHLTVYSDKHSTEMSLELDALKVTVGSKVFISKLRTDEDLLR